MKKRWHINFAGEIKECTAQRGKCPYGEENHFDSKEEARRVEQERSAESYFFENQRKRHRREILYDISSEFGVPYDSPYFWTNTIRDHLLDNEIEKLSRDEQREYLKSILYDKIDLRSLLNERLSDKEKEEIIANYGFENAMEALFKDRGKPFEISHKTTSELFNIVEKKTLDSFVKKVIEKTIYERPFDSSDFNPTKEVIALMETLPDMSGNYSFNSVVEETVEQTFLRASVKQILTDQMEYYADRKINNISLDPVDVSNTFDDALEFTNFDDFPIDDNACIIEYGVSNTWDLMMKRNQYVIEKDGSDHNNHKIFRCLLKEDANQFIHKDVLKYYESLFDKDGEYHYEHPLDPLKNFISWLKES